MCRTLEDKMINAKMNRFLFLVAGAVLSGLACFLILHFIFSMDKSSSFIISSSGAVAGIVTEYLRPYFISLEQKQKDEITNRVRRNLTHRQK